MSEKSLIPCSCHHAESTAAENPHPGDNSRREFLKNAGKLGLAGVMGTPLLASGAPLDTDGYLARLIKSSASVQAGRSNLVTILHTADIHSQLLVHDEFFWESGAPSYKKRGGFATLKTMINSLRNENPANTLVIDGGDCFQGSGVAALSEGRAIIPLMNNIGYDIMLPGNWEVVYGKNRMISDMLGYKGAKVCANMFHDTSDEKNGQLIFPPYFIKNIGGVRVGFIGYNDPLTPKRQSPAYSAGIRFSIPEENLKHYIKLLKEKEACAMVFLLTHMGLAQQVGLSNKEDTMGADFILGADTHERVREPIQGKYARVTEPGAFGSFVARLDLVVEKGTIREQAYQLLDVDPEQYKPDPEMTRLVDNARKPYQQKLNKVIGFTTTPLMRYYVLETPLDNLITDALMWKFKPDIALSNGFRFCHPLVPDPATGKAAITRDYLWSMLPVDSEAKTGYISGGQLLNWMEKELENAFAKDPANRFGGWVVRFKGMRVNFTIDRPMGSRVNSITVNEEPLDLRKNYAFVACEREGDPDTTLCRVDGVANPKRLGATLHQVMEEYLAKHSPVSPVMEGRCTATDAPPTLLTQLQGFGYEFR